MTASRFRFRGWDGERMHTGTPLYNKLGTWLITEENPHMCAQYGYIEIDEFVKVEALMQSTGLCAKSGKEIFERDVLGWDEHKDAMLEIVYIGFMRMRMTLNGQQELSPPLDNGISEFEIIGNAQENPELMEAK